MGVPNVTQLSFETPGSFLASLWYDVQDGHHRAVGSHTFLCSKDWSRGKDGPWREDFVVIQPGGEDLLTQLEYRDDSYFTPNLFRSKRRKTQNAMAGRVLWADLDETAPGHIPVKLPLPSLAWETSPGRYQALWFLKEFVGAVALEEMNRMLTYAVQADSGGWSLTKVLRLPGTISRKYQEEGGPAAFEVRLVNIHGKEPLPFYDANKLTQVCVEMGALSRDDVGSNLGELPDELPSFGVTYKRHLKNRPNSNAPNLVRIRSILGAKTIGADEDRSAQMWKLLCLIFESTDASAVEAYVLVKNSVWNKYKGQRREEEALWREVSKAMVHVGQKRAEGKSASALLTEAEEEEPDSEPESGIGAVSWAEYVDVASNDPEPSWLVEHVWAEGAYGLIAGEAKAFKTTFALDMAVSVARGYKFLGMYETRKRGPVLYVHQEGRRQEIVERVTQIVESRERLHGRGDFRVDMEFPLYLSAFPNIALNDEEDMKRLVEEVRERRPRLLIMEPFYLLSGGVDENSAEEVTPVLDFLGRLAEKYECAVMLSHHMHKSRESARVQERISGTGTFGRWYESMILLQRKGEEEDLRVRATFQHRSFEVHSANLVVKFDPYKVKRWVEPEDEAPILDLGKFNPALGRKHPPVVR